MRYWAIIIDLKLSKKDRNFDVFNWHVNYIKDLFRLHFTLTPTEADDNLPTFNRSSMPAFRMHNYSLKQKFKFKINCSFIASLLQQQNIKKIHSFHTFIKAFLLLLFFVIKNVFIKFNHYKIMMDKFSGGDNFSLAVCSCMS